MTQKPPEDFSEDSNALIVRENIPKYYYYYYYNEIFPNKREEESLTEMPFSPIFPPSFSPPPPRLRLPSSSSSSFEKGNVTFQKICSDSAGVCYFHIRDSPPPPPQMMMMMIFFMKF